ncbi:MAG: hypothetical protein QXF26_03270, partial [Candidatus Bathyarchaeia archaeon]
TSSKLRVLLYLGGFGASFILFRDYFFPFNLLVGACGLLKRGAGRVFMALKTIESNVYAVLVVYDLLALWGIILFNLMIGASSTILFLLFLRKWREANL